MSEPTTTITPPEAPADGHRPRPTCLAPSSSVYLDQMGNLRACCQATLVLGNVATERLPDIWNGATARRLRATVAVGDLSDGCEFCWWQVTEDDPSRAFLHGYDHLGDVREEPAWPKRMELSLSNRCNLQCVMCNGDWSSSIRTHREHRTPLVSPYDDRFFEDLRPFLHHVEELAFLGGEPFLGPEANRVWDLLIEDGLRPRCTVTTNGTQWGRRVERVLAALPFEVVVSMEGATKATYEASRVGADHAAVLRNLDHFRSYARAAGTSVSIAHCLMSTNVLELGDFLLFAEERELPVSINVVSNPPAHSLEALGVEPLAAAVRHLEAQEGRVLPSLSLNRRVWIDQLDRLRTLLATVGAGTSRFARGRLVRSSTVHIGGRGGLGGQVPDDVLGRPRGAPDHVVLADEHGHIVDIQPDPTDLLGADVRSLLGGPLTAIRPTLERELGSATKTLDDSVLGIGGHCVLVQEGRRGGAPTFTITRVGRRELALLVFLASPPPARRPVQAPESDAVLRFGAAGAVTGADGALAPLGLELASLVGQRGEGVLGEVIDRLAPHTLEDDERDGDVHRMSFVGDGDRLEAVGVAQRDAEGVLVGVDLHLSIG
jgi:hypothetical protein